VSAGTLGPAIHGRAFGNADDAIEGIAEARFLTVINCATFPALRRALPVAWPPRSPP
jgi:hypothetical protein